jgi:hypothetical protein
MIITNNPNHPSLPLALSGLTVSGRHSWSLNSSDARLVGARRLLVPQRHTNKERDKREIDNTKERYEITCSRLKFRGGEHSFSMFEDLMITLVVPFDFIPLPLCLELCLVWSTLLQEDRIHKFIGHMEIHNP